jgi:hypothetical protein
MQLEEQDVLSAARHSSEIWLADARAHSVLGSLLRHLAEVRGEGLGARVGNDRFRDQIKLFCEALAAYGKGLAADPLSARLLMSWANVRQILGPVDCQLPLTQGDYASAIVQALELNPTDVESKYAASLLLLWGNAPKEAWRLMREVLRFNTELTESQRRGILSRVQEEASLRAIVPARFPQIVYVSEYLDANPLSFGDNKARQKNFVDALAELQREAIASSVEEYSLDAVPYSIHTDRLIRLSDFAADDSVRQRLDRELSTLVRRRSQVALSDYLSERASLKQLQAVYATMSADTRPAKNPIVKWGGEERFHFDEFYRSVGFYLSAGQAAQGIELQVSSLPNSASGQLIKIFVSEDNQNWSEITSQVTFRSFELGRRVLVTMRFPARVSKYWKIHYSSANRERLLLGLIPEGVRVYGTSNALARSGRDVPLASRGESSGREFARGGGK